MAVPAAVAAAAAAFRRGASRPTDSGTPAMRTRGKESPCPLLSLPEKKAPVLLCLAVVGRFRRGGRGGGGVGRTRESGMAYTTALRAYAPTRGAASSFVGLSCFWIGHSPLPTVVTAPSCGDRTCSCPSSFGLMREMPSFLVFGAYQRVAG